MKQALAVLLAVTVATCTATIQASATAAKKAICPVCAVTKGEMEEETVHAVRTYEGKEYSFCSEKCAKDFMADPLAFIPREFPYESPAFAIQDLHGDPLTNESLKGKVVLLDFWATWCGPCRKVMPELQALHDKYAERGFSVVGVSIDVGGTAKVKKYVESKKLTYPMAMDSGTTPAWNAFRVKAVPTTFLIDRDGRIVAQWTGVPATPDELESKVAEMLRTD